MVGQGHHANSLILVVSRLGLEPRALALKDHAPMNDDGNRLVRAALSPKNPSSLRDNEMACSIGSMNFSNHDRHPLSAKL